MKQKGERLLEWMDRHYLFIVTVFVLWAYGLVGAAGPHGDPIRSDGAGYYAYLPSLLLYGDPSFETDADVRYGGEFPYWTYVRRYPPTGRYLNAINIGVSLMTAPFFLAAHALTLWFGFPWKGGPEFLQLRYAPDGYSFFYQHGAGLAGVFYFLLGFALLKRILARYFSRGAVLAAMTALLLGTNLLHYGAVFTVNAHPFTFFLTAVLMECTRRWYETPDRRALAVGLGTTAALLYLVRPLNVLLLLWVPLYGVSSVRGAAERLRFFWRQRGAVAWMGAVAFVWLIPQFLAWKYSTGHFLVKAYQHVGASSFGWPQLPAFFFGLRKGMFPWFPVFALALPGFWFLKGEARACRTPVAVLCVLYALVISSLRIWEMAGGFGNRYLVDMTPFLAFPLAAFYAGLRARWCRVLAAVFTVAAVAWALFLLTLLLRLELDPYGLDRQALFDVFWWRKEAFLEWWRAP